MAKELMISREVPNRWRRFFEENPDAVSIIEAKKEVKKEAKKQGKVGA